MEPVDVDVGVFARGCWDFHGWRRRFEDEVRVWTVLESLLEAPESAADSEAFYEELSRSWGAGASR